MTSIADDFETHDNCRIVYWPEEIMGHHHICGPDGYFNHYDDAVAWINETAVTGTTWVIRKVFLKMRPSKGRSQESLDDKIMEQLATMDFGKNS